MVEWTTRFSSETSSESISKLRDWKLNQISDFMKDISCERLAEKVKSSFSESYLNKKLESSSVSAKCPEKPYSMESARIDADRLRTGGI